MSDLDLSALRKVAEAATLGSHGQWLQDGATRVMLPDKRGNPWDGRLVADVRDPIDVQHVAAFDPATVLALLDELERLRSPTVMEYGVARRSPDFYLETLSRHKEAAEAFVRHPPIGYERPDGYVVVERQKAGLWREVS